MASTFGGYSAAGGQQPGSGIIKDFLSNPNNSTPFVNMVVSRSVLLSPFKNRPNDVIEVAQNQVYPRIGLILAAAKDLNNKLLFQAEDQEIRTTGSNVANTLGESTIGTNIDTSSLALSAVFTKVLEIITIADSPFSEGVTAIAAALTAAILIRQIPLAANIDNLSLGDKIEDRAIEDLERLTKLYEAGKSGSVSSTLGSLGSTRVTATSFYLALDIDKTSLPSSYFDVGTNAEVDTPVIISQSFPGSQVRTLERLATPGSKITFAWMYLSTREAIDYSNSQTDANGNLIVIPGIITSPPIERTFRIGNNWYLDDITEALSQEINSYVLETAAISNILCSPNRGEPQLQNVALPKKKLYETATTFERKIAAFPLFQQIDYLSFDARRATNIVSKDLIILRFFTLDKVTFAQKLKQEGQSSLASVSSFSYQGVWDNSSTYSQGDLVDLPNGSVYVFTNSASGNSSTAPGSAGTNTQWAPLYVNESILKNYRNISQPYIEGLLYGLVPSYTYLDKRGPKSLTIVTNNGEAKALSTNSSSSTSVPATDKDKAKLLEIDTLFFKKKDGALSINGNLRIRLSSTNFSSIPDSLKPLFDAATQSLIIPFVNVAGDSDVDANFVSPGVLSTVDKQTNEEEAGAEIALAVLEKLYAISQHTDVLAALVLPNAIQFTSFTKNSEDIVREIIDVLEVPDGLELATGTVKMAAGTVRIIRGTNKEEFFQSYIEPKTQYSDKPRSIIINAVPTSAITATGSNGTTSPKAQLPNNSNYGVVGLTKGEKSERLQNVYDKLDFLQTLNSRRHRNSNGSS